MLKNLKPVSKLLIVVVLLGIVAAIWYSSGDEDQEQIYAKVEHGPFEINVVATGELNAEHSEKIMGPRGMRRVGVWNTKITDLIAEGTYVNKGEYIAELDRSELANKLKEIGTELDKITSEYKAERLDTALTLREARDNLVNLKYALEEKELILKQSKYEPPATIRQAEINLEKAEREHDQAVQNYQIKKDQAEAKVSQVAATLRQTELKYEQAVQTIDEFTIKAPKSGMLVYHRDWDGKKIQVGSQVSAWDPVVATLPDMSSMISRTYINEIDISKVQKDQAVDIKVDAFPDKDYSGKIVNVANVGEQLPNSDAKVFEVDILLSRVDTILRPSMTTSNNIHIHKYESVLFIPIEAVMKSDSVTYVYKRDGIGSIATEIKVGVANDNFIIVEEGLAEGEEVLLSNTKTEEPLQIERL
ncbi:MAG: RND transporter [Crocinitomicaceae bacterium]|nr:RND transporter [Crocinitomicaceae bacterium]